jgi:hypothetical protein
MHPAFQKHLDNSSGSPQPNCKGFYALDVDSKSAPCALKAFIHRELRDFPNFSLGRKTYRKWELEPEAIEQ